MDSPQSPSVNALPARTAQSIRRIMREYEEIRGNRNPYWTARPINDEEPYEWHFTVRGPIGTEFEGGIYHGKIGLAHTYPLSPPSFTLLNQNGRFEVGRKVCLSASNFHPELWQPAWGIRTMLDALHAFFSTPADGAIHSLDWPPEVRRRLAKESRSWKCPVCGEENATLVEKYCGEATPLRPVLPASMLPSSVTRRVPGLRFGDAAEEETPREIESTANQAASSSSQEADYQRRRRLRSADRPSHSRLPLSALFRIFVVIPHMRMLAYFLDPTIRVVEKSVVFIDFVSALLLLFLIVLLFSLAMRPAALSWSLLMDG